jgi:hypothetical protein
MAAPVMDLRPGWSCAARPAVSERLRHVLHHVRESRWDGPRVLAVDITSPSQSMNALLEGDACDK